jgi:hypothetical protein
MTHLDPEELIDAVDGVLPSARRQHLDICETCRHEAASLRALMVDVRAVDVPEPSPYFWNRLSTQVRHRITEAPPAPVARWFQWPVVAPLAAMALLVIALVGAVADFSAAPDPRQANMPLSGDPARADEMVADAEVQWALLAELVGDLDFDAANEAGIVAPLGSADAAILQLSTVEQEELARLLRQELRVGG